MTAKRQTYHHGALRDALVSGARQQLAIGGAETLSLRNVARTAGVDASAVYRHFASKDDLMQAVAAVGFSELVTQMEAEIAHSRAAAGSESPAMRALISCGEGYLGFATEQPEMFSVMSAARVTGDGKDILANRDRQQDTGSPLGLVAECLDALGTEIGLAAGKRGEAAQVALAGLHGLAQLWVSGALGRDPGRLHALGTRLLRLLVAGLREKA